MNTYKIVTTADQVINVYYDLVAAKRYMSKLAKSNTVFVFTTYVS